ncbi:hypothetical protein AAF712_010694 [Marasmius tenuissimus]|uniref:Uncharacterized protein n=1 Tax=Marasmius tenuissimus TaxID=585030 RepID=A0ABR2ZL61_9AGAR
MPVIRNSARDEHRGSNSSRRDRQPPTEAERQAKKAEKKARKARNQFNECDKDTLEPYRICGSFWPWGINVFTKSVEFVLAFGLKEEIEAEAAHNSDNGTAVNDADANQEDSSDKDEDSDDKDEGENIFAAPGEMTEAEKIVLCTTYARWKSLYPTLHA